MDTSANAMLIVSRILHSPLFVKFSFYTKLQ
jgi:hypothetical protein